jgi:hypothetical protein
MSKVEVNTVEPQCGTTLTVGKACGSVRTASNNLQASDGGNLISQSGTTITLGASGDTINLASGASQTGFGRTGTVDWETTPKTATFTATNGDGYFANTSGGAFTMNLPAGAAGSIVSVQDYNNTFNSNNLTISPNGSEKINGSAGTILLATNGEGLTLVYVDSTVGWRSIVQSEFSDAGFSYISATGGTILTVGDYKTHVFTGPGTFCVSSGNDDADYFVVAGGGGTGGVGCQTGGGGAGGFRLSNSVGCIAAPVMSPLTNPTGIPISSGPYPITVGAGGAPAPSPSPAANNGSNSIFSSITSTGGGSGRACGMTGATGGSGGGGAQTGAVGNTPPVSPPQGNEGGNGQRAGPMYGAGGGGGAGNAGGTGSSSSVGNGGIGSYIADTFMGPTAPSYGTPGPVSSTRYFAGGGGGGGETSFGSGGTGGGGAGAANTTPTATGGTTNTGGGAGSGNDSTAAGAGGGSGIVMIRYKFQ